MRCSAASVSDLAALRFPQIHEDLLELVQTLLPASIALNTNLDTTEDDFLSTLKINTQLDDIAIIQGKCTALHSWTAQTNMIQEGTRTTLDIFDEPLTIVAPELAMPATDDLALETNGGCRLCTCLRIGSLISLRVSANLDALTCSGDCASDDGKGEGGSRSAGFVVGDKANGRGFLLVGRCGLGRRGSNGFGSDTFGGRGDTASGCFVGRRGRRGIRADGGSSCTGHILNGRLVVCRLRLGSLSGQGTLTGDSRDPAVCRSVATKRGARWRVACAGDGRCGTSGQSGRPGRGWSRRGGIRLICWSIGGRGVKVVVGIAP